jgi:hypothetical protein
MGKYRIHSADESYSDDAQRPCARGERCASRNRNGEPARGPRVLCFADRDFLIAAIQALPEMYLELYMVLGEKGSGSDGPRVSGGGKTPPIPIRPDVDALMRRIIDVLSSWDERVHWVARLAGPDTDLSRRRRDGVAMTTMCRTLSAHVDALLALEPEPMMRDMDLAAYQRLPGDAVGMVHTSAGWISYQTELGGGEAAQEIFTLHAACEAKLGRRPQHHDLLTPCWNENCEQRMLRRWDGSAGMDDHVECRSCGDKYAGEQLQRLMVEEELAQQRRARKEAS